MLLIVKEIDLIRKEKVPTNLLILEGSLYRKQYCCIFFLYNVHLAGVIRISNPLLA